ncbi:hypothetical protein ACLOJK_017615 [Asimina triloba]
MSRSSPAYRAISSVAICRRRTDSTARLNPSIALFQRERKRFGGFHGIGFGTSLAAAAAAAITPSEGSKSQRRSSDQMHISHRQCDCCLRVNQKRISCFRSSEANSDQPLLARPLILLCCTSSLSLCCSLPDTDILHFSSSSSSYENLPHFKKSSEKVPSDGPTAALLQPYDLNNILSQSMSASSPLGSACCRSAEISLLSTVWNSSDLSRWLSSASVMSDFSDSIDVCGHRGIALTELRRLI